MLRTQPFYLGVTLLLAGRTGFEGCPLLGRPDSLLDSGGGVGVRYLN
jgi:hypothetical protein